MSLPMAPPPSATPKQMSSRLLTMKFMQRASVSNTPSRLQTPPSEPALKRRKTDHTPTSDSSGPNTPIPESKAFVDRSDIRAAIKAESAWEAIAASRRAELGYSNNTVETQWVLDVNIPTQQNGVDDAHELSQYEEDDSAEENGRQIYGAFKRGKKTTSDTPSSTRKTLKYETIDLSEDDDEEGEFSDEDDDDDDDDDESVRPSPLSKKRIANAVDDDENDDSALDHIDLSKSKYAKSKGAGLPHTGAKPTFHRSNPRSGGVQKPYAGGKYRQLAQNKKNKKGNNMNKKK